MIFSRLSAILTVALAGTALLSSVVAEPVDFVVRSPGSGSLAAVAQKRVDTVEAQVFGVFTTLKSDIDPHLSTISAYLHRHHIGGSY